MSTVILNENGIKVERSNSTYVTDGVSKTYNIIYIWAGQDRIMDVTEPSTLRGDGTVTICGDWRVSVAQDLNLLLPSTTVGDLPPYSELASTTTNAGLPRPTETRVEIGDQTFVLDGVTLATKIIQIVAGEATVAITLTLAPPASPGLAPQGLHSYYVPSVGIKGQWVFQKCFTSSELREQPIPVQPKPAQQKPAQPTSATTPNLFRRMSAMIKGRTDTSKQPKETEKEATVPAAKGRDPNFHRTHSRRAEDDLG